MEKDTHNILENFLQNRDSMPHSFLFLGKSGGKELAEDFARKITNQEFPNVDTVQFDAANKEENTGVDAIREILHLASLKPVSGNKKVVVMDNMNQASPQMLNALLKTLEEPPAHAVFILISSTRLISTVMSRCQTIILPHSYKKEELTDEVSSAMELLESSRKLGLAEKLALVNTLASLDDELLPKLIEQWMYKQADELKLQPQKFKAVRATMETLQALRGNFNKKMVLQNFVTLALV